MQTRIHLILRDLDDGTVWKTENHHTNKRKDDFHREVKEAILNDISQDIKKQFGKNCDIGIKKGEIILISQYFDEKTGRRSKKIKGSGLLASDYFVKITSQQNLELMGYILRNTKELAIDYKKITGRSLGITGEVSEYEAAIKMDCTLCEAGKAGHDLIDCNGKRVQVKGRVLGDNIQRVGAIEANSTQKPWDYVLLVILDEQYEVIAIYKAEEDDIENEINRPRPRNGKKRRNLTVPDFVRVSQKVWPVST